MINPPRDKKAGQGRLVNHIFASGNPAAMAGYHGLRNSGHTGRACLGGRPAAQARARPDRSPAGPVCGV
jgi:hypothetical protein